MEHSSEMKIDGRYVRMAYTHKGSGTHTDAIEQARWSSKSATTTSSGKIFFFCFWKTIFFLLLFVLTKMKK